MYTQTDLVGASCILLGQRRSQLHSHCGILLHAVFKISSLILGECLVQPLPDASHASQVAATLNYTREVLRQSLIVPSLEG